MTDATPARSRLRVHGARVVIAFGLLAGALLIAATGPSSGRAASESGISIQAVYTASGNPSLVANFAPEGALARPHWSICRAPDVTICEPATSDAQFLTPGATPAGTVFEATATYQGRSYTARSAVWTGTVQAASSPGVRGSARYGRTIRPSGAVWTGGWQPDPSVAAQADGSTGGRGRDFDQLSIEVCRTRTGSHCVNLSAPAGEGFSGRPAVLGDWFTGWYVFAFDERFAHDILFALPGYQRAADIPALAVTPTVARSAPLGPVIGPPAPRVSILRRGRPRGRELMVARVRCSVRCRVSLTVSDNLTGNRRTTSLIGSSLIGVPIRRLRRGALRVRLYVDDGPTLSGTTRLGQRVARLVLEPSGSRRKSADHRHL